MENYFDKSFYFFLSATFLICAGFFFTNVYADPGVSFWTSVRWAVSDFSEAFLHHDSVSHTEAVAKHALEDQIEHDKTILKNEVIPMDLHNRIESKVDKIKDKNPLDVTPEKKSKLDLIRDALVTASELNEIKMSYKQCFDALNADDNEGKNSCNKRVNALQSWQNYCVGNFDIYEYKPDQELETYQMQIGEKHCEGLLETGVDYLNSLLIGKT